MLKFIAAALAVLVLLGVGIHVGGPLLHGQGGEGNEFFQRMHGQGAGQEGAPGAGPVTISFAQNDDFYLCNDPFFQGIFEVIQGTYQAGLENVTEEILQQDIFAFIRSWPDLTQEEAEGWVEHIRIIPGQLIDIAREDPTVVENCDSFSVAMVGPP